MRECPQFTTLLRWRDAGEAEQIEAHLADCPGCAQAWKSLADLTALGMQMPSAPPAPRQIESVRTQLLANAKAPPARRAPPWIAIAAALLVGLATWSLWPTARRPIGSISGATADYAVRYEAGVERVALRDGSISIEVAHLPADQRFVVQTADAEIEVRGTRFTVIADGGRLHRVEVTEGRVELRRSGHATVALEADQSWQAGPTQPARPIAPATPSPIAPTTTPTPTTPAPAPLSPAPAQQPTSVAKRPQPADRPRVQPKRSEPKPALAAPETAAPAAAAPPSPQTEQFEAGWRAVRAGEFDEASAAFSAAARLRGPLAADARWWHIVSLGRAGHDAQTRVALTAYLKSGPPASRRAEAQVMLGWLNFSTGRVDAAERAFKAGASATRAKVRAGAFAGLKAIADWRAQRR